MKTIKRESNFLILTAILMISIIFSIAATVQGSEKQGGKIEKNYLAQVEKEYRKELRNRLEEQGYQCVGITMTKITEEDTNIQYTIKLNHKNFLKISNEKKEKLINEIASISFQEETSEFSYEFL